MGAYHLGRIAASAAMSPELGLDLVLRQPAGVERCDFSSKTRRFDTHPADDLCYQRLP